MKTFELIFALCWIPVHMFLLPVVLVKIPGFSALGESWQNLIMYAVSFVALTIAEMKFIRRDFDPLCDNFGYVIAQVLWGFAFMLALDLLAGGVLSIIMGGEDLEVANQNNDAIVEMFGKNRGPMTAIACFLAPISEELMFRGAIFGGIRKKNRFAAYAVSMLLFAAYHVYSYAIYDPSYWIYILQYLPVSYVLCRVYESSNSIWGSMLFHGVWNYISVCLLNALEQL